MTLYSTTSNFKFYNNIVFIGALFLFNNVCNCCDEFPIPKEFNHSEVHSIYDDRIPLPVLDQRIIKGMTDPQKDKGDNLLMDAYNYFNILDDIEILLKEKNPEGVKRTENLIKSGGPKFVNVTMADDFMRYLYKWDPSEFNELRASIDGTKAVWERILKRLEDIKSGNAVKISSSVLYHSAEQKKNMTLFELDNLIVDELIHPKEGGGRKLLKHTFKYYDILSEVKEMIEKQDIIGFDILRNITKKGPKWIKTKYDEEELRDVYNWESDDFKHLNATIDCTYNVWHSFNFQLYKNLIDQYVSN